MCVCQRALVFNSSAVDKVEAFLDDEEGLVMTPVGAGPLFTVDWVQWKLMHLNDTRLHTVMIKVTLTSGAVAEASRTFGFSIEAIASVQEFGFVQRIILMARPGFLLATSFGISVATVWLTLASLRLMMWRGVTLMDPPESGNLKLGMYKALQAVWIFTSVDRLLFPYLAFLLYIAGTIYRL